MTDYTVCIKQKEIVGRVHLSLQVVSSRFYILHLFKHLSPLENITTFPIPNICLSLP